MNLFGKGGEPAEVTGTAALRSAVEIRNKQKDLSRLARECNTSILALENFINGADLNVEIKKLLARELYGANVDFDPVIDRLVRPEIEAKPVATIGEIRFDPNDPRNKKVMTQPVWAKGTPAFTPVDPLPKVKPSGMLPKRPGFR
jgi:hypothetical protein